MSNRSAYIANYNEKNKVLFSDFKCAIKLRDIAYYATFMPTGNIVHCYILRIICIVRSYLLLFFSFLEFIYREKRDITIYIYIDFSDFIFILCMREKVNGKNGYLVCVCRFIYIYITRFFASLIYLLRKSSL